MKHSTAATWLERIGLLEHANRQASNLAYGDQRRLEIARCMVTQPEILMLDEPAAGLNPKETKELDELIAELRNHHNTTILLIEHDMEAGDGDFRPNLRGQPGDAAGKRYAGADP